MPVCELVEICYVWCAMRKGKLMELCVYACLCPPAHLFARLSVNALILILFPRIPAIFFAITCLFLMVHILDIAEFSSSQSRVTIIFHHLVFTSHCLLQSFPVSVLHLNRHLLPFSSSTLSPTSSPFPLILIHFFPQSNFLCFSAALQIKKEKKKRNY